ncbi:cell wall-binding repeat-containing protein [Halobacillus rhizosphaerae]|uniref:cell wall-binding repeat-containing protein n=1 Tax=Halobacillus rhizosphaerae TaxID=3064889 RepID=UPI00398AF018
MLTEAANEADVPPEVVKAIAFVESNGWKQDLISSDGGIGIMQVTTNICDDDQTPEANGCYDEDKLKNDIQYNINAGVEVLNEKWKLGGKGAIPTIEGNDRHKIESWYFAVMAYNGLKPVNSPIDRDGNVNVDSYQYKVFQRIENSSLDHKLANLPFKKEDFTYDRDSDANIIFNKLNYDVSLLLTESTQMYKGGKEQYYIPAANLKQSLNDGQGSEIHDKVVTINSKPVFGLKNENRFNHFVYYKINYGDNSGYITSNAIRQLPKRLKGDNRIETAIEIAKDGWEDGADTVVLTRADEFPDALAGAPLAHKFNAPILLTNSKELSKGTEEAIQELGAQHVILLGGSKHALLPTIADRLTDLGITHERISGSNRYQTAQAIAEELGSKSGKAVVATGDKFPDALAAAPYAARNEIPILLTKPNQLPASTKEALKGVQNTLVTGGLNAVSEEVESQLPQPIRKNGTNRYETAKAIVDYSIKYGNIKTDKAYVATGEDFADALTGAALAAKEEAPLLLVKGKQLTTSTESVIKNNVIHGFVLLGGTGPVPFEDEQKLAWLSYELEQ